MQPLLSKQQCSAARGLAIMSIMLHNICHNYHFSIKESEFEWAIDQTLRWGDYIQHPDTNLVIQLFSCFGYIGVAAFIFLGGYGLVRKYEQGKQDDAPFGAGRFIFNQYRKLLALVLVPQLLFPVLQFIITHHTSVTPGDLCAQFTMTTNFLPMFRFNPFIYWYLGMMMQLYIVYALLYRFDSHRARGWIPVALIAISIVMHNVVPPESLFGHLMRVNVFVGLIPFSLGMLAARYMREEHLSTRRAAWLLPVLVVMFLGFTLNFALWGIIYAVGAAMFVCMARLLWGRLLKAAEAVGKVSALIFVLHPLTRYINNTVVASFIPHSYNTMVIIYIVLTALAVWAYRKLKIDTTVNRLIAGK